MKQIEMINYESNFPCLCVAAFNNLLALRHKSPSL